MFESISESLISSFSQISLLTKLVPSPDWFIGLDSLDLCQDNNFIDSITTEVRPFECALKDLNVDLFCFRLSLLMQEQIMGSHSPPPTGPPTPRGSYSRSQASTPHTPQDHSITHIWPSCPPLLLFRLLRLVYHPQKQE